MLKQVVRNQPSLSQVVFSADQFTALSNLVSSVCELAREKIESCSILGKQLRLKTTEVDHLQREAEILTSQMKTWKDGLSDSMSSFRKQIMAESDITSRWLKEVKREREKNEFNETTLREYSSKVSKLRAEASVSAQQIVRLQSEKDLLAENFKRVEAGFASMMEKCRDLRDQIERQKIELQKAQVAQEMELHAERTNRSKENSKVCQENKDLLEKLKDAQDCQRKLEEEQALTLSELTRANKEIAQRDKELKRLGSELDKAHDQNKKLQEAKLKSKKDGQMKDKADATLANQLRELERQNSDLLEEVQKLKTEVNSLKKPPSASRGKDAHQRSKSSDTDLEETQRTLADLKLKHTLLVDLLKKGIAVKFKEKSTLLKELFGNAADSLPKLKKSYLELLSGATKEGQNKGTKQETDRPVDHPPGLMDIEQPERQIHKNTVREMTPEKTFGDPDQEKFDNDTAFKKSICSHKILDPTCTSCLLLNKECKNQPLNLKHRKGG